MDLITRPLAVSLALLQTLLVSSAPSATVSVNPAVSYQTIDGFGGFGGVVAEYASEAQYTDAWVRLIADTLGLTIHRYFLNPNDLEPTNDNTSPFTTNLSAFNLGGRLGGQLPLLSRLKAAGVEKFFFSILSPPYWMKQGPFNEWCYGGGDCSCCGGTLPESNYDEFAEFCAAYVKLARNEGIELHALSVQNEPRFSEPYPACVYTNMQLRETVKKVGARLASEGLSSTGIMVAEDVLSGFGSLEGACIADTASRKYVKLFGTHAYSEGGIVPTPGSGAAQEWTVAERKMRATGLPFWMTETSGYESSWSGAFAMATGIYTALQYGSVSGWVYYRLGGADDALTNNGSPTWLFYGAKQYYRYVRPGAVRVSCVSDDSLVSAQAFVHGANRTLALVLFNHGTAARTVSVAGTGAASCVAYRSSSSERCVSLGATTPSSLSLPPLSITTLYGTEYEPPAAAGSRPPAVPLGRTSPRARARSVLVWDVRGRALDSGAADAAGVYAVVSGCQGTLQVQDLMSYKGGK